MFTTSRPLKYFGPVNGRDRREKIPPDFLFPDEEGEEYNEMLEYLSIYTQEERSKTQSMVYACPRCEVRIANEEDMVSRPFIWLKEKDQEVSLNAVFKKTSNLVSKGGDVCCYRCSTKLFDYCLEDPFLLTIPMFQTKNRKTLLKRPYRMLSLIYTEGGALFEIKAFDPETYSEIAVEEQIAMFEADDYPRSAGDPDVKEILHKLRAILEAFGKGKSIEHRKVLAFGEYCFRCNTIEMEAKALSLLEEMHADFGTEFVHSGDLERHDAFTSDKTYDVALLLRTGLEDQMAYINHVDFNDDNVPDIGKLHMLPWLVSGGNFVFADWGSPIENEPPSDSFDAEARASVWACKMEGTNRQPTFAKLLRDGHFIGSWSCESPVATEVDDGVGSKWQVSDDEDDTSQVSQGIEKPEPEMIKNEPTPRMLEKIERALSGDLLYPNWLFLHDYPSATFTETYRSTGRPPFATRVKDAYEFVPNKKDKIAGATKQTSYAHKFLWLLDSLGTDSYTAHSSILGRMHI